MLALIFRTFILFLILFSSWHIHALDLDTNYIRKFSKKNQIRVYTGFRNAGFRLENANITGQTNHVNYEPNARSYIGAGVSFWQLGLSLSLKLPESKSEMEHFGKTNYRDYNLTLITRRYGGNLWYRDYQGLYINNPKELYSDWQKGDPLPQRKDLKYQQIGGDVYWVFFTKRFSINACMKQSERQIKSAGSLMVMSEIQSININADSTIIPNSLVDFFNNYQNLQGINLRTASLSMGYVYCFVHRAFFLCPSIFAGPGFINQKFETGSRWINSNNAFTKIDIKLHFGVNIPKFFAGMKISFSNNISNTKQLEIQNSFSHFNIFGGIRF